MQFEKIQNNPTRIPELVMDSLLKAIEAGKIRVGDELPPERDLAEALGISRNSLRECLSVLSFMGIVENRGNRKILVKNAEYFRNARSLIELSYSQDAFEDFMERFQIDSLDFGMIHYVDQVEDYEEIMNGPFIEYVRKLKSEGTIEHIGLSTHNPDIGLLAAQNPEIELLMFSINPAFDMFGSMDDIEEYRKEDAYTDSMSSLNPQRDELYRLCEENGTALTVMKGFAGGNLLSDETSPFGVALTPVQCIHYALSQKGVSSIFVGVKNPLELEESLKYCSATEAEKDYSETLKNAPKHSFEGQCTYCGHCQPCTSEIDIAMVNKLFDLAKNQDGVPASIQEHYNNLKFNASDCIACGDCEERCPFNVHIVDVMLDAQDLFGF